MDKLLIDLHNSDTYVRIQAVLALGQLGDVRAVDELLAALHDRDEVVRYTAANALIQFREQALDGLLVALSDPDEGVSRSAAHALGRIGTPEALAAVENWRQEQSENQ